MKLFINKTLSFLFIPIIVAIIIIIVYKWSLNRIVFPKDIKTVICGDSHTQSSINDKVLKNSINISQSSEHFLYTYNVLSLTIKNNPQIKRIILGVSFHSFSESYDSYIFGEKSKFMFPRYLSMLDIETVLELLSNNTKNVLSQIHNVNKNIFTSLLSKKYTDYPFYGAFYKSQRSNLNDSTITIAIQRHYYTKKGNVQKYSAFQHKYLNKIVDLCSNRGIELIFINCPISVEYKSRIPIIFIDHYYTTINNIKNCIIWDYNDLDLKKECYGDGDHLNYLGAEILSKLINTKLAS